MAHVISSGLGHTETGFIDRIATRYGTQATQCRACADLAVVRL